MPSVASVVEDLYYLKLIYAFTTTVSIPTLETIFKDICNYDN